MWKIIVKCGIIKWLRSLQRKGGGLTMIEFLIKLIQSIVAGVVSHSICRWLDKKDDQNQK